MKRYVLCIGVLVVGVLHASMKDLRHQEAVIQNKMDTIKKLVEEAAVFFDQNTLGNACHAFNNDIKKWRDAIEVFDVKGNCYLFGSDFQYLWDNFAEKTTQEATLVPASVFGRQRLFDRTFVEKMAAIGEKGGWITFNWNDALNYSYAKTVVKNGVKYILFAGFYPESARFKIQQLVKSAIDYGGQYGSDQLFQQINNPVGLFVDGNDFLFAFSLDDGVCYANGQNTAFVGQNLLSLQDSDKKHTYRAMIEVVKNRGAGWVEVNDNGIVEYVYVELYRDSKTKRRYVIGGGYYPFVTEETVVAYVKRAIEHLKASGSTIALRDFTSYVGGFITGPLRLTIFDMEGNVLADAGEPILIGHNILKIRDSEGRFVVQDIINMAKKQGYGWISLVDKHAYKMVYAELIETPDGKFIVSAGFWPSSKEKSAQGLVQKAATFFQNNNLPDALHQFTTLNSHFFRGDLYISVFDKNGICFARGIDTTRIWNDERKVLDDQGNPIIDRVIQIARQGGGWIEYKDENNLMRRVYAIEVIKPIEQVPGVDNNQSKSKKITKKDVTRMEQGQKEPLNETYYLTVGYYL